MKKYITAPIYYVNDVPHLGHAYTTVAADVLARYYRLKGDEVRFLTGTDEHGQKNAESAQKAGLTPQEYVDKRSDEFRKTFEELGVEFGNGNIFMRTTDPKHAAAVNVFMKKLYAAGALEEGEYEGLYCKGCEDFKTEKDLVDGLCPIHKTKPELLKEKNWFFKLRDYKDEVRSKIESGELAVEPAARRNEVLGLIKEAPDFSVTRQRVDWGIPFFKDESQIIYVWVEALQNYISALGYPDGEDFKNFWQAEDADVTHLMAKDIVKFHAIYWPAMLLAAGEKLPKKIFAHGFFTLNGAKMSKSLGNVIHPSELVNGAWTNSPLFTLAGADVARYLLMSQFPFGHDGDIREERFLEQYNADLVNGLGNLVSRVSQMVALYLDGVPKHRNKPGFIELDVAEAMDKLRIDHALHKIWDAIKSADHLIDQTQPWELAKMINEPAKKEQLENVLSQLVGYIIGIATELKPFMPETAEKILQAFNSPKIEKMNSLFPRLKIVHS